MIASGVPWRFFGLDIDPKHCSHWLDCVDSNRKGEASVGLSFGGTVRKADHSDDLNKNAPLTNVDP